MICDDATKRLGQAFTDRLAKDKVLQSELRAILDMMQLDIFNEWQAGKWDDWSIPFAELSALKRVHNFISRGISNGKST